MQQLALAGPALILQMEIGEPVKPISQTQPQHIGILHISSAGPTSEVYFITFMYVRHVFFFPERKTEKQQECNSFVVAVQDLDVRSVYPTVRQVL
jgi:hypothetical protein